jgi:hypothetical protein
VDTDVEQSLGAREASDAASDDDDVRCYSLTQFTRRRGRLPREPKDV